MFDWFKKDKDSNVVPFPDPKEKLSPVQNEPTYRTIPNVHYSIGATDDNRICMSISYVHLTMNRTAVQNLIDQLAVFRDQLSKDEND